MICLETSPSAATASHARPPARSGLRSARKAVSHLQREVLFVLRAGYLVAVMGHVFEERGDDALWVHRQADQGSLEVE